MKCECALVEEQQGIKREKTMSCLLAGSAIAQGPNVGRIDRWPQWKPTRKELRWLLLSGASDPPSGITISDRRTRDDISGVRSGTFLSGVADDLANMERVVENDLFNTVKDLYLTKSVATGHIMTLFDTCKRNRFKPMLYYTGHGEKGTGNWCFKDGKISIQEILNMLPEGTSHPMIFSDACYSGHWANFCLQKNVSGFHCLAACPEYSKAIDTRGEGGDLTLFMTGKKERPRTEPIYSGGNRNDFPITPGYDYDSVKYTEFVGSHLADSENIVISQSFHNGGNGNDFPITTGYAYDSVKYTEFVDKHLADSTNIVISQSFHNGCFSVIFAPSNRYIPRPVVSGASRSDYDSFIELVNKNWNLESGKSKQIYSLACDENSGFGVLFLTNYGTEQKILTNTSDIEKARKDGFKITSCAARGPTFYIIMTKGTREYKKKQAWFTLNSWNEAKSVIQENQDNGRVVTGICYSIGQRKYLVVVMGTSQHQIYQKFRDVTEMDNWVKKEHKQQFHPSIIFKDPCDGKTLVVMIRDRDRSSYTCKYDCKVVC